MARIALVHDVAGVAAIQAELLRRAGHQVDQISLPAYGAGWRWPAKAVAMPLRLAAYLPVIAKLRSTDYDVIHIHWLSHGIVGVLARRPFFAQAHGSDVHLNLNRAVYPWVTRTVLRRATRVFYVTPNLRSYLRGFEDKLVYLPNPIEVPMGSASPPPPRAVSRVLIFTRLDPIKGVDRIFPAAEPLSRFVEVTAMDWGPLAGEYKKAYARWVKFVPPVPHDEVAAFLQGFDIVVGQMRQGVLGIMDVEAMAAGRPLIAAVDPSLYEPDPPPVIAAAGADDVVGAVERLREAPAELSGLASRGREWAARNHGYEHHLRLLESAYFGRAET